MNHRSVADDYQYLIAASDNIRDNNDAVIVLEDEEEGLEDLWEFGEKQQQEQQHQLNQTTGINNKVRIKQRQQKHEESDDPYFCSTTTTATTRTISTATVDFIDNTMLPHGDDDHDHDDDPHEPAGVETINNNSNHLMRDYIEDIGDDPGYDASTSYYASTTTTSSAAAPPTPFSPDSPVPSSSSTETEDDDHDGIDHDRDDDAIAVFPEDISPTSIQAANLNPIVAPNDMDALVAKQMAELSMQDREKVNFDIHGVSDEIAETPAFVETK
jgi:hypothetical protein